MKKYLNSHFLNFFRYYRSKGSKTKRNRAQTSHLRFHVHSTMLNLVVLRYITDLYQLVFKCFSLFISNSFPLTLNRKIIVFHLQFQA